MYSCTGRCSAVLIVAYISVRDTVYFRDMYVGVVPLRVHYLYCKSICTIILWLSTMILLYNTLQRCAQYEPLCYAPGRYIVLYQCELQRAGNLSNHQLVPKQTEVINNEFSLWCEHFQHSAVVHEQGPDRDFATILLLYYVLMVNVQESSIRCYNNLPSCRTCDVHQTK